MRQFRLRSRIINETGIADLVNDDRTAAEIEILSREILKPNEITDTKKGADELRSLRWEAER